MTRRLKRTKDFNLSLEIINDNFLRTPRDSQRNWLLNRSLKEFHDELEHLDAQAKNFVPGKELPMGDRTQGELQNDDIMEDWQIPVMKAMADHVGNKGGDVLEIGFGRGIASDFIQAHSIQSHTIIECNDHVVARFQDWKQSQSGADIRLVHGLWQDTISDLGLFDAIFFHTYPLNEQEFVEQVAQSSTFAEHFFPIAAEHLRQGGVFTYLTNEVDSLSRSHQRSVLKHFRSIDLSIVQDLKVPDDTRDAMWGQSMVVVRATK